MFETAHKTAKAVRRQQTPNLCDKIAVIQCPQIVKPVGFVKPFRRPIIARTVKQRGKGAFKGTVGGKAGVIEKANRKTAVFITDNIQHQIREKTHGGIACHGFETAAEIIAANAGGLYAAQHRAYNTVSRRISIAHDADTTAGGAFLCKQRSGCHASDAQEIFRIQAFLVAADTGIGKEKTVFFADTVGRKVASCHRHTAVNRDVF